MTDQNNNRLSEAEAELLAQKMIEQSRIQRQAKLNGIKSKISNAKDYALESQEGSFIYIVKWIALFISETFKGFREAIRARRIERDGDD